MEIACDMAPFPNAGVLGSLLIERSSSGLMPTVGGFDANSGIFLICIMVLSSSWKSGLMCTSSPSETDNKTSAPIPKILALTRNRGLCLTHLARL